MYLTYNGPGFVEQQVDPISATYDRREDQMVFPASSYYQPTNYDPEQQPPFTSYDLQKNPVVTVTSYSPDKGHQGSPLLVYIESVYNLLVPSIRLNLMFATRLCPSRLTPTGPQKTTFQYVLTAEAPAFSSTGWHSAHVPLRVHIQDESALIETGYINAGGSFFYTDGGSHDDQASPDDLSRKRMKMQFGPSEVKPPAKRASNQQLHSGVEAYPSVPFTQSDSLSNLKSSPPDLLNPAQGRSASYGRSQNQRQFQHRDARRNSQNVPIAYGKAPPVMDPSPQIAASSAEIAAWAYPYGAAGKIPGLAATSASRMSSMSSPPSAANPPLIRTSTLQQSSSSSSSSAGGSFNPYAIYPHSRATLKIDGDLDSMVEHWTADEWSAKRRIVRFSRSQSGSEIHTSFEPVAPNSDRPPSSICISCILWEERRECFVTSVDTIFLLESIIAVGFTVEEKNRIRRNLEGFRPMTVSKAKSDSEDFFKVIMGFPNPKPRNIEKDVKVFPWKILAHALRKIVGKYVSIDESRFPHSPIPPPDRMTVMSE